MIDPMIRAILKRSSAVIAVDLSRSEGELFYGQTSADSESIVFALDLATQSEYLAAAIQVIKGEAAQSTGHSKASH